MENVSNNYNSGVWKCLSSCFPVAAKSKLTDVALLTGITAFSVLGILASMQAFTVIDAAMTLKFSYGMYGAAFILLILQVARIAMIYCKKANPNNALNGTAATSGPEIRTFVRPVPLDYVSPKTPLSQPVPLEELDIMRKEAKNKAEDYARGFYPNYKEEAKAQFLNFIMNVIDDQDFQKDTTAYLKAWKELRNKTNGFMDLQDVAFSFFENYCGKV